MVDFHQQAAAQRVDERGQDKAPSRFLKVQVAPLDLGTDQVAGIGLDLVFDLFDLGQYFLVFHVFAPILAKRGPIVKWKRNLWPGCVRRVGDGGR